MKKHWKHGCLPAVIIGSFGIPSLQSGTEVRAQEPADWCGTESTHGGQQTSQGDCPINGICDTPSERDSWIPDPFNPPPVLTLRIKIHVFCYDDGSSCTTTTSEINAQMNQLNSDFAPYKIQFVYTYEFIDDSTYRNLDSRGPEVPAMKNTYADDPAHQINVYVVNMTSPWGRGTFPWDPEALGNMGGILVDSARFGSGMKILTHECGHNLGLWHTMHGVS